MACRQRIVEELNKTEGGKLRVDRMLARTDRYFAEEVEKGARLTAQGGIDSGPQAEAPRQAFVPFAAAAPPVPTTSTIATPHVDQERSQAASTTPKDFEQPVTTSQEPTVVETQAPQQQVDAGMDVDLVTATVKGQIPIDHGVGDPLTVVGGVARRPDVALSGSESVRAQKGDRGELDAYGVGGPRGDVRKAAPVTETRAC